MKLVVAAAKIEVPENDHPNSGFSDFSYVISVLNRLSTTPSDGAFASKHSSRLIL